MATATMATAAGAAMLLYLLLSRRFMASSSREGGEDERNAGDFSKSGRSGRRRIVRRPAQAPATWFEVISTLSETIRFTYSETLGKWPIGDLAFGINFLLKRQGNLHVASVYAGSGCLQLKGPGLVVELIHLLRLLALCMYFSKKPFPVFLESAGFSQNDVLLQEPKAGLLKPAFTILCDRSSNCFLLLIRGTHSIKDTLTAATGAVVPFHHSVLHEGGVGNLVLGYAHCGMVAAARWIAKLSTPCLLKAVGEHPDFKIKIVGHSLGGGTAALLTYILRERKEFSSSTCVAFAPAACMTWDLAESGMHFITAVINGSDLVPTFSTASIDDLRSEVTSSSWLNDLRDQIEHTRFLSIVYRSAFALGSHLPSMASARARVAGAGAFLLPVSNSTKVVMKRAQNVAQAVVRTRSSLSSWSCMGARRRTVSTLSKEEENALIPCMRPIQSSEAIITEPANIDSEIEELAFSCSRQANGHEGLEDEEEDGLVPVDHAISSSRVEDMSEGELWYELEKELHGTDVQVREEEEAAAKEITEEESAVLADAGENSKPKISESSETLRFYPPGRIMHIVALPPSDSDSGEDGSAGEEKVGIYETPRYLYGKLRLSRTMINDHYMPMYKKMMELLIHELEKDSEVGTGIL